jgi:endonuclease VIII-like 1
MPELAEVKIMGDFINAVATNQFFDKIEKSPVSKVKTELTAFDGGLFTVKAASRGKELMLELDLVGGGPTGEDKRHLMISLGMSGSWAMVRHDSPKKDEVLKHAHLRLITNRGDLLVLHDVRRFAKWRWGNWNSDRGPCPLTEFNEFANAVRANWQSSKAFNSPVNELLMNQGYFNGVGNYLRAEILYRTNIMPFTIAKDLNRDQLEEILKTVHFCVRDAYTLGGGQLKDWVNPNGVPADGFGTWMQVYGKGNSVIDKTGRRFWYDPCWETHVPTTYKRSNTKEIEGDI